VTSDQCIACHSNLHTASGDDVSIGYDWRASMMANSARDPYWHAAVRREVLDHPSAQAAIEDKCATCHMPMARFDAATGGGRGEVFANLERGAPNALALDGVSCTVCHQISASNLGTHASFDGGFAIETATPLGERPIFGPHAIDGGRQGVMQSAALFVPSEATHLQRSELCATCHTLFTQSLNDAGEVVGELPEQFVEVDGVRYSHVVDPRTGVGLTSGVTVTVRAPTGFEADGWATAASVLDSADRAVFIAARPRAAFYVRFAASSGRSSRTNSSTACPRDSVSRNVARTFTRTRGR
jgi:hypothetical protein